MNLTERKVRTRDRGKIKNKGDEDKDRPRATEEEMLIQKRKRKVNQRSKQHSKPQRPERRGNEEAGETIKNKENKTRTQR